MNLPIPSSLPDFQRLFPDEEACEKYLFHVRWPDGFVCPSCGGTEYYRHGERRLVICTSCRQQVHLTADTIMHKSHMPILTWFYGAFVSSTLTPGISAIQFQKVMGLSRYETAFQMLHKIRSAMVNPDRDRLHGTVEVDETYVGGVRVGAKGGRSIEHKTVVAGAVEVRTGKGGRNYAGRVRFRTVPDATAKSLIPFVQSHVLKGSMVITDGWIGYHGLRKKGYDHRVADEQYKGQGWMRLIHLEFSNLKTEVRGTYHGRIERQHLQTYLNEFVFRHNRRFFDTGAPFLRVLQYGVTGRAPTYEEMYKADEYGRNVHVAGYGDK